MVKYENQLLQYKQNPHRFKTYKHGDDIWVIGNRDDSMTIQPWTETGEALCLVISNKEPKTARTILDRILVAGISLNLVQGTSVQLGESVHTFAHNPENVLEIGKIIKAKRKQPIPKGFPGSEVPTE